MHFQLPPLPYAYSALEPHMDARTLELHHFTHHAAYVAALNAALEDQPELHERPALWLLLNLSKVPAKRRSAVHHNAGGHVNHSLFWRAMCPGGSALESGPLANAIKRDFGGFERFTARFVEAGMSVFGSGWVWLTRAHPRGGRLEISVTPGHDNPLMHGHYPLLVCDVWEHAYYLQHQSRRAEFLNGWWPLVNWNEAVERYERSDHSTGVHLPNEHEDRVGR